MFTTKYFTQFNHIDAYHSRYVHFIFQIFDGITELLKVGSGHKIRETKAMIHVCITDLNKLRYLLRQASSINFLDRTWDDGRRATLTVSGVTPFNVSFSKSKERLFVSFKYVWYNRYGVCQNWIQWQQTRDRNDINM